MTLKCNKATRLLTVNGREEDEGDHIHAVI